AYDGDDGCRGPASVATRLRGFGSQDISTVRCPEPPQTGRRTQSSCEPNRTEPNRTESSRAEPGRTEPGRGPAPGSGQRRRARMPRIRALRPVLTQRTTTARTSRAESTRNSSAPNLTSVPPYLLYRTRSPTATSSGTRLP